jgi:hypothetical protein
MRFQGLPLENFHEYFSGVVVGFEFYLFETAESGQHFLGVVGL